jgi:hypothetical protein
LKEIAEEIARMFESNYEGLCFEEEFQNLRRPEGKKNLLEKEIEWRLKSRAI